MLSIVEKIKSENVSIWENDGNIKVAFAGDSLNDDVLQLIRDNKSQLILFLRENNVFSKEDFSRFVIDHGAANKEAATNSSAVKIKNDNIDAIFPANSLQQGFVFHHLSQPNDDAYRVQSLWDYKIALDIERYQNAWRLASLRYPILRTAFNWEGDGDVLQVITKQASISQETFTVVDLSSEPLSRHDELITQIQIEDRTKPFDLSKPGLLRFTIIKLGEGIYSVLKSVHHSISDGWSGPILLNTVHDYYRQLEQGVEPIVVPETTYLEALSYYQRQRPIVDLYWSDKKQKFASANDLNRLLSNPIDLSQVTTIDRPYETALDIDGEQYRNLKLCCQQHGVTINVALQFAWHKLIEVYTNDDQTIVGTTVSGRDLPIEGIESSVGLYINTLPLSVDWGQDSSIGAMLNAIQNGVAELNSNSSASLASLQGSGERLFHSLLVFENYPKLEPNQNDDKQYEDDTDINRCVTFRQAVEKMDYPLAILAYELSDRLVVKLNYSEDWLSEGDALRLLSQMSLVFKAITDDVEQSHQAISLLSESERATVVETWNQSDQDYPEHKTLIQLFEQQAAQTPDQIALVFQEQSLTYRELNQKANQLSNCIRKHYCRHYRKNYQQGSENALSDKLIGLYLSRSLEMVISILAVLKTGAAYVPISPDYPKSRTQFILSDTATDLVLTEQLFVTDLTQLISELDCEAALLLADAGDGNEIADSKDTGVVGGSPADLAYVIYTSGTTGNPKGVMVEHRSVVNTIYSMRDVYAITPSHRKSTCFSNYVFDVSVSEIFNSLLFGGELHILDESLRTNTLSLANYIEQQAINFLFVPPAILAVFPQRKYSSLQAIIFAGEPCDSVRCQYWAKNYSLYNYYGPTEATIYASGKKAEMANLNEIGQPLANLKLYVLNSALKPLPINVPGELYIAGVGLARGYLNRDDLTAEKFIENPFATELDRQSGLDRLYKTGDIVRWSEDGNLDYIGRNDTQVKVRGYRIELGEIESALSRQKGIEQAVVVAKQRSGNTYLAAYIVAEHDIDAEQLKAHLGFDLPDYMLPNTITRIESLPLTVNGKVNVNALPEPQWLDSDTYVSPRNALEQRLCDIWQSILGLDKIGIDDNFFRIGGDSIVSIQLLSQLRQAGYSLQVKTIFDSPSIRKLADSLMAPENTTQLVTEQGRLSGEFDLLPVQRWFFDKELSNPHHWNQAFSVKIPAQITHSQLESALDSLCAHHDMLTCRFIAKENETRQHYCPDFRPRLNSVSVANISEKQLQKQLTDWQSGFHYLHGPLWQAAHLTGYEDGSARLVFAFHHLIIDVVSWRILINDIRLLISGQKLPNKGSSYRQWVSAVSHYADTVSDELAYWKSVFETQSDYPAPADPIYTQVTLPLAQTDKLLHHVHSGFHTEINDLLLSALALALNGTFDKGINHVTLEGHGREAIDPRIDVSNAVGWFTSMYPIRLNAFDDIGETIVRTKEMLRGIPQKGIGFGAQYYKSTDVNKFGELPPISFNYLGQLNKVSNSESEWQLLQESCGEVAPEDYIDDLLLNINGAVQHGILQFRVQSRLCEAQTERFTQRFESALLAVIETAELRAVEGGLKTPSDYSVKNLSIEHLRELQNEYAIDVLFPANSLQQGFVFHYLNQPNDQAYRVQAVWDYKTALDIETYQKAWELASLRFPALRTAFNWQNGIVQVISSKAGFTQANFKTEDISDTPLDMRDAAIGEIQRRERSEPFDLSKPGLMKFTIVKQTAELFTIVRTAHHSISDGWSAGILLDTVHDYYQVLLEQGVPEVVSESAYLDAQEYYLTNSEAVDSHWATLKETFGQANDINNLLSRKIDLANTKSVPRPADQAFSLAGDEYQLLKRCCQNLGVTLNVVLQFAWHKLLRVYTQDEQTVVGTTVSGRDIPVTGIESSVGLYINTLPLAVNWHTDSAIEDILYAIQNDIALLNSYSSVSLASLQEGGERLFHSLFVFENYPESQGGDKPSCLENEISFRRGVETIDYPLALIAYDAQDRLELSLSYGQDWLDQTHASRLLAQMKLILDAVAVNPAQSHNAISLLDDAERNTLQREWVQTTTTRPSDKSLAQLFQDQVEQTPNENALMFDEEVLTYNQLNNKANYLANKIKDVYRAKHGTKIGADTIIALYFDRSVEMVVSILAVLKAGAAYLPLDPENPEDRNQFMLRDTHSKLLLTQAKYSNQLDSLGGDSTDMALIAVDDALRNASGSYNNEPLISDVNDLAYVIYTSGTTGEPKGVMVDQKAVASFALNNSYVDRATVEVVGGLSSYSFDGFVFDLFFTLFNGSCLCLLDKNDLLNSALFNQKLTANNVDTFFITTALFNHVVTYQDLNNTTIKTILFGGEKANNQVLKKALRELTNIQLTHVYGPTETVVFASAHHFRSAENNTVEQVVPIGSAINNKSFYVLDEHQSLVPIGACGELYIGGDGMARGYLNREKVTADSFVNNPFDSTRVSNTRASKLYKTGDLVRWLEDGTLEYLRRKDRQVKIRGYRIELDEIGSALSKQASIESAFVIDKKTSEGSYLAAYFVAEQEVDINELRGKMSRLLPSYMLPNTYTKIDEIPLTINGKLNTRALPEPVLVADDDYVAPIDNQQRLLCDIWQTLLGIEKIGINDNFFQIGGDSIISIQLVARLRQAGFELQVKTVFDAPTIAQLSDALNQEALARSIKIERGVLTGSFPLLPVQQWFFDQDLLDSHHFNQAFMVKIPSSISLLEITHALSVLSERHDMLRCRFEQTDTGIQQRYFAEVSPVIYQASVEGLDEDQLQKQLSEWQSGFDYIDGDLWSVAHLTNCSDGSARLFMAFHHLIIDAVSWRIIAEDLRLLFTQKSLSEKTSSYRQWVSVVENYAAAHPEEQPYWKGIVQTQADMPVCLEKSYHSIALTQEQTSELLLRSNLGYGTHIEDLLLSALALSLQQTFERDTNHIILEGHGRESLDSTIDISETVGWFTSIYPVELCAYEGARETIIRTKEMLRKVPNKGIGFGALGAARFGAMPRISFNYLGQFGDASKHQAIADYQIVSEKCGQMTASTQGNDLLLNINGAVQDGVLVFGISSQLSSVQSKQFNTSFEKALNSIIGHACSTAALGGEKTPSDYIFNRLSLAELRKLESKYAIEQICQANSLQQGFVFHHLDQPDDDAYRVQSLWDYKSALDIQAYQHAWALASVRYPILRTAFNWDNDVLQIVDKRPSIDKSNFDIIDISHLTDAEQEVVIQNTQAKDRTQPFDLSKPGLIRFTIIKRTDALFTVLKSLHHSISDGWSASILMRTVHQFYDQLTNGLTPVVKPELAYTSAQQYYLQQYREVDQYWSTVKQEMGNANDLNCMFSQQRDLTTQRTVSSSETLVRDVGGSDYQKLKQACQQLGVTRNVALQFAWHKLVNVYSQDEQTIVGTTVSGRDIPIAGIESSVGLYINTLPLIVDWRKDASISDMLKAIQATIADINSYSSVSLASLQHQGERLFHSLLVFENYPAMVESDQTSGIESTLEYREVIEKVDYPLSVMAYEDEGCLTISLSYDASVLTKVKAGQLLNQLESVLLAIAKDATQMHTSICLVKEDERESLINWGKGLISRVANGDTNYALAQLFEQQVKLRPNQIALESDGEKLSYQELNSRANRMAHCIRASVLKRTGMPLDADNLIALYFDRSTDMLISMLAVLKAGGAYVPISPEYPIKRTQFILHDTQASLVLTQTKYRPRLVDWSEGMTSVPELIDVENAKLFENFSSRDLSSMSNASDLAYVIYTSGTTGQPKGVMIEQGSVVNYSRAIDDTMGALFDDVDFSSNYCFDLSVTTTLCPLILGRKIYIYTGDIADVAAYSAHIENNGIRFVKSTPSLARSLLPYTNAALDVLVLGGEALSSKLVEELSCHANNIFDEYGPTEATVGAMISQVWPTKDTGIGRPYPNVVLYNLTDAGNFAPVGVAGELYIGGAGVARGYLNRPALTSDYFIDSSFLASPQQPPSHGRLYKTGDKVRWSDDGCLQYLGRNDTQVKIRGYRVELGEIEHALLLNDAIQQVAVVAIGDAPNQSLAAYYVSNDSFDDSFGDSVDESYLRASLSQTLPSYMQPSDFVKIDAIPLTNNGKLDIRSLPDVVTATLDNYRAPRTARETKLCEIWQQVLGLERVGIDDNFFAIGGNSISAIKLTGESRKALGADIPLSLLFEYKTIAGIASNITQHSVTSIPSKDVFQPSLSFAQERLFFIENFSEGSAAYHIPKFFELTSDANLAALKLALNQVSEHHAALKTVYLTNAEGTTYQQLISDPIDLDTSRVNSQLQLRSEVQGYISKPFDLTSEASIRAHCFDLMGTQYLVILIHHIAFDAWSDSIFMRDLSASYSSIGESRPATLPAHEISYIDYAVWQREHLQGETLEQLASYWQQQLSGYQSLALPLDYPRPLEIDFRGGEFNFTLDAQLSDKLRELALAQETTLYTVLLSGFYLTLATLSGQRDIVIGTPSDNRHHSQTHSLIGFFVNSLPIRAEIKPQATVSELVSTVHNVVAQAKIHQELPFEKILDALDVQRDSSRHPIYQVMFTLIGEERRLNSNSDANTRLPFNKVVLDDDASIYSPAKFDLSLLLDNSHSEIVGSLNYALSLFKADSIERIQEVYSRVLGAIVESQTRLIGDIDPLAAIERQKALVDWNQTKVDFPKGQTLHTQFEACAERRPNDIALTFSDVEVTYRQLNEQATQLAAEIRDQYQTNNQKTLSSDALVCLYFDRGIDMVISILATLKAGAAFVPISPEQPQSRAAFVLNDTKTTILLTETKYVERLENWFSDSVLILPVSILPVAETDRTASHSKSRVNNSVTGRDANDLAYVVYTSGTTGQPKGVMVEHHSVENLIYGQQRAFAYSSDEISILLPAYTFDAGIGVLLLSLLSGGTLLIPSEQEISDIEAIKELIVSNKVTHIVAASSYLSLLGRVNSVNSIRRVVSGGDQCSSALKRIWGDSLINEYGPTEATIAAVRSIDYARHEESNRIGAPVDNVTLYVLNRAGKPSPIGTPGELFIGGAGVTRGYLNQPKLSKQVFVNKTFSGLKGRADINERLYKTGDRVRWLADGQLEFLGRFDRQVKINGNRVELNEIENILVEQAGIQQAVVCQKRNGNIDHLVAYVVSIKEVDQDSIRNELSKELPAHMLPSMFVEIDKVPLTHNGKVDIAALPEPEFINLDDYVAPTNSQEKKICDIWQDVLGLDKIGIEDNFFRIGGDSITSIQLVAKMRQGGFELQVKAIFDAPTVVALSRFLSEAQDQKRIITEQGLLEGTFPLLPIQQWFFDKDLSSPHHWNQAFMIKVPSDLEISEISRGLKTLADRHDMLRCRFDNNAMPDKPSAYNQRYLRKATPDLKSISVAGLDDEQLHNQLTEWQNGFNYIDGPLWQAGHLSGYSDGSCRLFFAFHHLIIDVVSWRILIEDLRLIVSGQQLPEKGSSYRQWVDTVQHYSDSSDSEKAYWNTVMHDFTDSPLCQIARPDASNEVSETVEIALSQKQTSTLLRQTNQGYNTEINDLLMSALSIALGETFQTTVNHIVLEGHGREPIDVKIDVSQTVGWFTTMYPVRLVAENDIGNTIINTKEMLRAIPNKGIGFGALAPSTVLPRVSFNYLGQLGKQTRHDDIADWQLVSEACGSMLAADYQNDFLLSLNGAVRNNTLSFTIQSMLSSEVLERFKSAFEHALNTVIEEGKRAALIGGIKTQSDFGIKETSIEHLHHLQKKYQVEAFYPANSLQQGMIYHHLNQPEEDAYKVQELMDYCDVLDIENYKKAWRLASMRYPILRTAFNWQESILQVVTKGPSIDDANFTIIDISATPENERDALITKIRKDDRKEPFDLTKPGLIRFTIIRHSNTFFTVLKSQHHSIGDGWSGPILLQSVHDYYNRLCRDESPKVVTELAYLRAQDYYQSHFKDINSYWSKAKTEFGSANDINGLLSRPLNLSAVKSVPRPSEKEIVITGDEYRSLKTSAQEQGVTINVALQFAWHKLIQIYTQDQQTIVGTTVSGRDIPVNDIGVSVGLYINTLPLVVDWQQNHSIAELLNSIQQRIAELNSFSSVSLASLQSSGERLFHTLFIFENYPRLDGGDADSEYDINEFASYREVVETVDYPLSLIAYELSDRLIVKLHYGTDWIDDAQADHLLSQMRLIIEAVATDASLKHNAISLLNEDEKHTVVHEWNQTESDYPTDQTLAQLFEAQVLRVPDKIALRFKDDALSYRQLNEKANQLAGALNDTYRAHHGNGIEPGTFISLYFDRSLEMVISILAVLKVGGAYVPLDPEHPADRTRFMLQDTQSRLVLTQQRHISLLNEMVDDSAAVALYAVDTEPCASAFGHENVSTTASAEDLAYVIYTSGTTGQPKGVMVDQRAVASFAVKNRYVDYSSVQVVAGLSSYSFDGFVFDLFFTLLNGSSLCLMDKDVLLNPSLFHRELNKNNVDTFFITTALFNHLAENPGLNETPVKNILFGGEKADKLLLNKALSQFPDIQIVHVYGPTETVVFAGAYSFPQMTDRSLSRAVPIGSPLNNKMFYVLDEQQNIVPIGVCGELYIGGDGLARGYLNHPEMTADVFLDNPFSEEKGRHSKMYKTGDLVRWLADGNIEFIGRNDNQVKIRGYRIELDEIKAAIVAHVDIQQAVVLAENSDSGSQYIAAYYVVERGIAIDKLREQLINVLPSYMIPSTFTEIDKVPLTINGKIDIKSLPKSSFGSDEACEAPRNATEEKLVVIWKELLSHDNVGVLDEFYHLGGDSILLIRLKTTIEKQFDLEVDLMDLFKHKTIASFSDFLQQDNSERKKSKIHALKPIDDDSEFVLLCVPYPGGDGLVYEAVANQVADNVSVYSIDYPRDFDPIKYPNASSHHAYFEQFLADCVDEIEQEITLPIIMFGYCGGTSIAVSLAYLLLNRHCRVECLFAGVMSLDQDDFEHGRDPEFDVTVVPSDQVSTILEVAGFPLDGVFTEQERNDLVLKFQKDFVTVRWGLSKFASFYPEKLPFPIHSFFTKDDPLTQGYESKWQNWDMIAKASYLTEYESGGHYILNTRAQDLADNVNEVCLMLLNEQA